jgi:hypothetical protein
MATHPYPDQTSPFTSEHAAHVASVFQRNMKSATMKQGTMKYRQAHYDFYMGAMAVINTLHGGEAIPPVWQFAIMTNRDISDDMKPI